MGNHREMPLWPCARRAASAVLCFLVGMPFCVAQTSYLMNAGVGHTDNVGRTAFDEQSETIATAGVTMDMRQRTRRLTADIDVNASYLEYLEDTYGSEVVGTAAADINFAIIPGRLEWRLDDTFGQISGDRLAADTPDNRGYINVLSTGPTLTMRLGGRNRLELFGNYGRTDTEESPFDNQTVGGGLGWRYMVSDASSFYVRGRHETVTFDQQPDNVDYDRMEGVVGYRLDSGRTRWSLEGGWVEVEREDGANESGTILRLALRRQLTTSTVIDFTLGRQIAEAGRILMSEQRVMPTDGTFPVVITTEPVKNKYGQLRWSFFRSRTGLTIGTLYVQDRYDIRTDLDRDRLEFEGGLFRALSTRTGLQLALGQRREEFKASGIDFDETYGTLRGNMTFSGMLSGGLEYQHVRRVADDSAVAEYRDNVIWLRLFYGRGQRPEAQFLRN